MIKSYSETAKKFKVLSDPNRLMILDMISCSEMCACDILEKLQISQSTLSHHMKQLFDCGLIDIRRDGKWSYYSLHETGIQYLEFDLHNLATNTKDCICKIVPNK
ncbi:transcriptional regulator, ArsR family [Propionispira arboris]|uniref:Transcriptional regulator, ArsR family n=1 Tax=Propionispira arboris TaxID=84035 RepID=A0A1H6X9W8_9FIRM|nr:metalloregulator ArsR/SmtB family transcription factor [Propionispira arboris]SEJ21680.1 transcriptional regulator, ArsR family [Propionispira arboris]